MTTQEKAERMGGHSADCYFDEFGISPKDDGQEKVGDWDSSAWGIAEKNLRDEGMTDDDRDSCLAAWRRGFWI